MAGKTAVQDGPQYIAHRISVWDKAMEKRKQAMNESDTSKQVPIKITLPDGSIKDGIKGKTTPMDIASGISEGLARKALVALVDDKQWDMTRAFEGDCMLKICGFDTVEGKSVMWHSTAHMLGEAMEYKYKGELCIGPPLEDGFYYDMHVEGEIKVHEKDFKDLDSRVIGIAKEKRVFERMELTKEEAKEMFAYNKFKMELIEKLEDGTTITAYRDGPFIDLCRGPHIPRPSAVKAMMCKGTGQAYWLGDQKNASLQRVYGISFPDKKQMKEYKHLIEEAKKRDHRKIGQDQDLFMLHPMSPGCITLLPHGVRIFNKLIDFMKDQYWKRGYLEVQTPNIFDFDLWKTSGHAANYRNNMFCFEVENKEFGMKPMNCPSHCLIFAHKVRSYRELPMRLADFGVLHRNELSGTLSGLTRVRRFQQDDAHIFCTMEQVKNEIFQYLEFLKFVYDIFGFTFELELSTRPEKALGTKEQWNLAESLLGEALEQFTGKKCDEDDGWKLNPGDGAFYGPKIDIKVFDALKRRHQCATVQLDFQLPIRFDLQYKTPHNIVASSAPTDEKKSEESTAPEAQADKPTANGGCCCGSGDTTPTIEKPLREGYARPVIVHRAIYGSFERFFAILIEHYGGRWPFWLSPRQAVVIPVSEKYLEYADTVASELREKKFYCDVDSSDRKLGKKIREAELSHYNCILVVGEEEEKSKTVNIREGVPAEQRKSSIEELHSLFEERRKNFK